jgi:hypothetical protein
MPSAITSATTSKSSITVIQPSGERMQSTHAVDLLLRNLPPDAKIAHSLPGLTNNLLSVALLCNAGCEVFFHATGCEVTLNGMVILRGWRDPHHRLWCVRIVDDAWTTHHPIADNDNPIPTTTVANSLYDCDNTQQLIRFYHACLFSPVLSTLTKAINKGDLKGFPGLTAERACCHITINDATTKRHMDQTCQGQRSTHLTSLPTNNTEEVPTQEPDNTMINLIYMTTHEVTGQLYTDQTGRFPITSTQGHAYLVIFYVYNANFISSVPIKNRTKEELLRAYQLTYEYLTRRGFKPMLHKMDNETSKDVEDFIQSRHTNLQYTPLDMHCTNSAERAIRT